MDNIKLSKVTALPASLEPNTIYFVNMGSYVEMKLTNSVGSAALSLKTGEGITDYTQLTNKPDLTKKADLVNNFVPTTQLNISASDVKFTSIPSLNASDVGTAITLLAGKTADIPSFSTSMSSDKVVVTDNAGKLITHSSISTTELGYLDGLTDTIANLLSQKQDTISALTADMVLVSDSNGKLKASSTTTTELGYLSGVTSSIQTQLSAKQASVVGAASSIVTDNLTPSRVVTSDVTGKVEASAVTLSELLSLMGIDLTKTIQEQLNDKCSLVDGIVPVSNLPSYVSSIVAYPDKASFPATGDVNLIYVDRSTSPIVTYRWDGTAYVAVGMAGGDLYASIIKVAAIPNLVATETNVSAVLTDILTKLNTVALTSDIQW